MGTLTSLALLSCIWTAVSEPVLPMRVVENWRIEIGPGVAGSITVDASVSFDIEPPQHIVVEDEKHDALPMFNPKAGGWAKGAKPRGIQTEECSATDRLHPETLRVKDKPGKDPTVFTMGKDYELDPFWGTFGRIEGGIIAADQPVFLDYEYEPDRLDTIAVDATGKVSLFKGEPSLGIVLPAPIPEGFTPVARVFVPGKCTALAEDNLYPIFFDEPETVSATPSTAEKLLPKTLEKLRSGAPLTVVTFGDSVTCGGGVGSDQSLWWQQQFLTRLKEGFPKSQVTWKNAGWGGASSAAYINSPRGSEHDYIRDVLEPKPDLVIIEFVNDAYLDEQGVTEHYGKILADLRGVGAEVILMTPHLVRPDWMKLEVMKVKEDPRPYVRGLKAFGAANNVAVADASTLYCNLWRQGIPYMTLMTNAINHPDERGHKLFADALMALFPNASN